jgi:hypothetical protein
LSGLIHYNFLEKLEKQIEEILKTKDRVLIAVAGSGGTGKSFFGKYVRNKGLGRFNKSVISVIDDKTMWSESLFFLRIPVKIPFNGIDDLQPFLKKLPKRKKIIFYINATPWKRITKADILLKLSTDEDIRRKRIQHRYRNDPEKLKKALNNSEHKNVEIQYSYSLEAEV